MSWIHLHHSRPHYVGMDRNPQPLNCGLTTLVRRLKQRRPKRSPSTSLSPHPMAPHGWLPTRSSRRAPCPTRTESHRRSCAAAGQLSAVRARSARLLTVTPTVTNCLIYIATSTKERASVVTVHYCCSAHSVLFKCCSASLLLFCCSVNNRTTEL